MSFFRSNFFGSNHYASNYYGASTQEVAAQQVLGGYSEWERLQLQIKQEDDELMLMITAFMEIQDG